MISEVVYSLLFYIFAVAGVVFAIAVVVTPRLLRAAVYLMAVLLLVAGFYVMLDAEFLAGIQVLVYVGGIVVVIVFALMLTGSTELQNDTCTRTRKLLAGMASTAFAVLTGTIFWTAHFETPADNAVLPANPIKAIGHKLLDSGGEGYVLAFEIVSVLLLAALIGGIVVARKTPPPHQPFTSGGDLPGEVDYVLPHSQHRKREV